MNDAELCMSGSFVPSAFRLTIMVFGTLDIFPPDMLCTASPISFQPFSTLFPTRWLLLFVCVCVCVYVYVYVSVCVCVCL